MRVYFWLVCRDRDMKMTHLAHANGEEAVRETFGPNVDDARAYRMRGSPAMMGKKALAQERARVRDLYKTDCGLWAKIAG